MLTAAICPQVCMKISEWALDDHGIMTRTNEGVADSQSPAVLLARETGRKAGLASARARRARAATER
jgi:hypothetical protein